MCAWVVNYCLRFLLLVSKFYVNQCPWGWKLGKNGWLASHEIWRVQTYFSELIQWIASTLKGKLITEIMQLGSLRRTEIRIHWERKKKNSCFFLYRGNISVEKDCSHFQVGKLPSQPHHASNREGRREAFFLFWSLVCTRKFPWDKWSWNRKDHTSNNNNNVSVILKCICETEYAL